MTLQKYIICIHDFQCYTSLEFLNVNCHKVCIKSRWCKVLWLQQKS